MKKCIKCGAQLDDTAIFCTECGEKVYAVPEEVDQTADVSENSFASEETSLQNDF